jgi:hypothetical protein
MDVVRVWAGAGKKPRDGREKDELVCYLAFEHPHNGMDPWANGMTDCMVGCNSGSVAPSIAIKSSITQK